jgi:hypothetical protein
VLGQSGCEQAARRWAGGLWHWILGGGSDRVGRGGGVGAAWAPGPISRSVSLATTLSCVKTQIHAGVGLFCVQCRVFSVSRRYTDTE